MTQKELRKIRLKNDYDEMMRIRSSPMVSWVATKGTVPYVAESLLTIKVRTYSSKDSVMNECTVRITLPEKYPTVAPNTVMEGTMVFHPNWFDGTHRWCCGKYQASESLGRYVVRMIQTLQFDPLVTFPGSPANRDAAKWYSENAKNKKLFPSDNQPLPNPNKTLGFTVKR